MYVFWGPDVGTGGSPSKYFTTEHVTMVLEGPVEGMEERANQGNLSHPFPNFVMSFSYVFIPLP